MGWQRARLVLSAAFLLGVLSIPVGGDSQGEAVFRKVAPGIEHAELRADGQPVHAFRIDLTRAQLRLLPAGSAGERQRVAAIAAQFPEVVAVNASFFDEQGRAIGVTADKGEVQSARVLRSWGVLHIRQGQAAISLGSELKLGPERPELIVQGLPRLLVHGEIVKLKPQTAARTAICAAGRQVILVSTGQLEATALARLLRERLGCQEALNLDGGPSTQCYARLGDLKLDIPGGWGVPNALVAIPQHL